MRIYIGILVLTFASMSASADTVTITGLGNGHGWNDGHYYTGYVTLDFDGKVFPGLCIDALHETTKDSWDALYIPLTDAADVAAVMSVYFGIDDTAVYSPKLFADMAGFAMLSGIGSDKTANDNIQHDVWAQFAPLKYTDSGILSDYINGHAAMDPAQFGLIVDARYANGGDLQQAFLVDSPTPTPEPASVFMVGTALVAISTLLRKRRRQTAPATQSRRPS
ncbi:MAG: PEP-CTERM sorting domain-containing protein [Acidobacteriia bacterium]|nr:PEP-CTERM sorting domain-containing protein [Terriglobia bacterium]